MAANALSELAYSLGEFAGATRLAAANLRRAAAVATIAAAWQAYRRDAGDGDRGPAHHGDDTVLFTAVRRRDAMVLWLVDHAAGSRADAAQAVARMVGAKGTFEAPERDLLDAAVDALASAPADPPGPLADALGLGELAAGHPLAAIMPVIGAVDRLGHDAAFVEVSGYEHALPLPGGLLRHYVAAEPAGA